MVFKHELFSSRPQMAVRVRVDQPRITLAKPKAERCLSFTRTKDQSRTSIRQRGSKRCLIMVYNLSEAQG